VMPVLAVWKDGERGQVMASATMPSALHAELDKMRRNPEQFQVKEAITCKIHGGKNRNALRLIEGQSEIEAGSWCPVHGWVHFDSVRFPPTERLTTSEIEDTRLTAQRREAALKRKR
jgi:hypothetical protein